jgi:aryl-alcohol dehydrogenase-like predicted oxidoreductase
MAATMDRVDKLKAALRNGDGLPETALRFILSNPVVSTTIIGMRKPEHVRRNIAMSDAGSLEPSVLQEMRKHRWDRKPQPWSD